MHTASHVASTFHLDPLVVLGGEADARRCEVEDSTLAWCVRSAAHELYAEALEQLIEENKPKGR